MTKLLASNQLSTFNILRSIILADSTLSKKFDTSNVLEFEPKQKALNFCGYPYIVVSVPQIDDYGKVLANRIVNREFEIEITLCIEYMAKDNFTTYSCALLNVFDNSVSTLSNYGYDFEKIRSNGSVTYLSPHGKEVIEARYSLVLTGDVVL